MLANAKIFVTESSMCGVDEGRKRNYYKST